MKLNLRALCLPRHIAITAALLSAPAALAGGAYLEVTGYPVYRQDNNSSGPIGGGFDGDTISSDSSFSYDLRNTLGYVFGSNWLLGASFNYANAPRKYDATATIPSLERTIKDTQWGVSVGYLPSGPAGFRFIATYFFAGKKTYKDYQAQSDGTVLSDQELENKLGSGYQFTLGYSFALSSWLSIGPTLVYRRLDYKSQSLTNNLTPALNYTDREFSTKAIDGNLLPMISLIIRIGGGPAAFGRY
jgi:hypothetical protein